MDSQSDNTTDEFTLLDFLLIYLIYFGIMLEHRQAET